MKPAILGGTPIRNKPLPYAKQYVNDEDCLAVNEVLKSDFLTTGPKVKEFEDIIANYVGAKYAVAFSNGTAALHGACYAAGIDEGDEVITTPITFAASANCVLYMGGTPIFGDIDSHTFNIDVNEIARKITNKTKAIIPVDYTGQAVDIDAIKDLVKGKEIAIIEDGAHSLGTKYKGMRVGSIADMTMFSFHPVKTITTGEGGIITTNNEEYYRKLVSFRSHGITRDIAQLANKDSGNWYYEQLDLGFNYRMTDFQAALGISQMKKIDWFIERRKKIVDRYNEAFRELDGVILQRNQDFSDTVNHLYVLKLDLDKLKVDRKEIFNGLIAENIGVHVHYIPVYWHPYYQKLGYKKGLCPKGEELYNSILTVPLFPAMTDRDMEDVINGFYKIINYYRK
ncbi:UDP-4-amino-4,6-dideoxy-N-acetyl-beta-L-altrosamine transaminase [Tissierella praeacuta DSM 18095]|uniref:UDP-4-amino-4,6-dideoxy-N-acetyl-beta-L-altrosamine transaminase n=1 Tax=Tissierella praeacuta DSM 18095 TaxID=1123404 RepID=A0A1M4X215_9FIRM|nr:UDP-4-amino-4,6-dideoxy-N-acetyl-beta-L-altrosamine transaminase [Tissierella praeacuta]SHE87541.1 UDP-4-amino-4,6-dideoxy-N-acetyl-beta-L-altrosamine transaminase [Tissierella praeacuta DSM 18095]SUO99647.1 UDP-4-amino-4-deoxy-L-arabinose--oxoglutarate aminotransferase [Tissierella praeacuta]